MVWPYTLDIEECTVGTVRELHSWSQQGPECAISSFSEYILCAKTSFYLRRSHWPSGNVRQSRPCGSGFESWWFHLFGLNFYIFEWHGRSFFLHLPKDTFGVLSRLRVLLFHSCALKCFKPKSSLSTVLFTANIQRNRSQSRRRSTRPWVTWVCVGCFAQFIIRFALRHDICSIISWNQYG